MANTLALAINVISIVALIFVITSIFAIRSSVSKIQKSLEESESIKNRQLKTIINLLTPQREEQYS